MTTPGETAGEAVLRVEGACMRYGSRRVLTSASLTAVTGRITALLGRNGSGKSTLLRIAAGVMTADQGTVHFHGRVHLRPAIHRLSREGLFFLPERDLLVRNLSVEDQLSLMARRYGHDARVHAGADIGDGDVSVRDDVVAGRRAAPSVRDVAEELSLTECMGRYPHELSGGERRRAELALIELRAPVCLLADEPFMGVTPRDAELVAARLRRLADRGCAIVVTGHEVPTLLGLADDVVWVTAGTTHSLGPANEAAENWRFRREYLGA